MYYLTLENYYLANFENPGDALLSDRFCDRCHFATPEEAAAVARVLFPSYGSMGLIEEDPNWIFSYLTNRFDQVYRQCFPVFGIVRANYHPNFRFLLWEAPTNERIDLIYYNFSDRSISFFPNDEAQCYVAKIKGEIKPIWTGLNKVFVDSKLRTSIEDFTLHFWSILSQYTESLQIFERARLRSR